MTDTYNTIALPSEGFFKDKGSKFIALAFPVQTLDQITDRLNEVKKLHPKARHYCYAWRLGYNETLYRTNDDGEPSGTAGKPILGQIDSFEITDVIIIVVRYFGGTLLGTSGLIKAYRESAKDALTNASIIEKMFEDKIEITFDYEVMSQVMEVIKTFEAEIIEQNYDIPPQFVVGIRKSQSAPFLLHLKARIANMSLEEASTIEDIDGVIFKFV